MTDADIAPARAPHRSRTTSTNRLMEATSVAAVDSAPAQDGPGCETANTAAALRLNNDQQSKRAAYELRLKERGLTPSRRSRKDLRSIVRKKPRQRFRGVPPFLAVDVDTCRTARCSPRPKPLPSSDGRSRLWRIGAKTLITP